MSKRLLILDNSIDLDTYRPVEHWAPHLGDVPYDSRHMPSGEKLPSLDRYTHLLLTGSHASFSEPAPWFAVEADIVRRAVEHDLCILGSCFGHQMLVWSLSGSEFIGPAGTPELGYVVVHLDVSDPLLAELPNPWHAFTAHMDEVSHPPFPWVVLASNGACAVQAVRFGHRLVWGIQPHPEIDPDEARKQMHHALDRYPAYASVIQQQIDAPVQDDRTTHLLMRAFLHAR